MRLQIERQGEVLFKGTMPDHFALPRMGERLVVGDQPVVVTMVEHRIDSLDVILTVVDVVDHLKHTEGWGGTGSHG